MARNGWVAVNSAQVALFASTPKTVLQIVAAANVLEALQQIAVSFDGASGTAVPVNIRLMKQTTGGTMTPLTPAKTKSTGVNLGLTAFEAASIEPAYSTVLKQWFVHPQAGERMLLDLQGELEFGNTERVGLVMTAPAGVNVLAELGGEE